jgi:hypothetical protein
MAILYWVAIIFWIVHYIFNVKIVNLKNNKFTSIATQSYLFLPFILLASNLIKIF